MTIAMRYVGFTDDLRVGNRQIDQLHAKWFELADWILQMTAMELDPKVLKYKVAHFLRFSVEALRLEESVLRRCGYPALQLHRLQHLELITAIRNLLLSAQDGEELRYRLREGLIAWIVEHVAECDQDYAALFTRRRRVAEPRCDDAAPTD